MKLKMRKFLKNILKVKYFIVLLLIVIASVVVGLYFKKDLIANKLAMDNMEFSTEGFTDYYNIEEPMYDSNKSCWTIGDQEFSGSSTAKVSERDGYWYIGETNTNVKASMYQNKIVSENNKYIMFIDEMTTIVTIVEKESLKDGGDAKNPNDYVVKYSSAISNDIDSYKTNFVLSYASSSVSKIEDQTYDAFSNSVNYKNAITGQFERHYELKYLADKNAVQIYYTIGSFGTIKSLFPDKMYATVYEPARCLYDSDAEYNKAVEEYKETYLKEVGSLDNTFEERFRGNTQISLNISRDKTTYKATVYPSKTITVYTQEARDYILDTVLPELEAEGLDVKSYDKFELDEEAKKLAETTKNKQTVSWKIDVPEELVDTYGEYYKKYFNNENSPLTNNPFMTAAHYNKLRQTLYSRTEADGKDILYPLYKIQVANPGGNAIDLYNYLYSNEQTNELDYKYYMVVNGEEVEFSSSGFVAKDKDGNFIYDENGRVTKALYSSEMLKEDNSKFDEVTESLPLFKIALEFKLTDEGYVISVPVESLIDASTVTKEKVGEENYKKFAGIYQMYSLKLCPYMTYVDNSQDGYIVVPDGSGAVINFNNGKVSTVSGRYYGVDNAYVNEIETGERPNLLLGMYAFVNTTAGKESGLIAAIEKGGGQFTLTAGVNNKNNFANLDVELRSTERVATGTISSNTSFKKYDKTLTGTDLVVNYIITDENNVDYDSIAKIYRDYLIKREGLTTKDNTNELLTDLTFLGAFDKYALLLGIKYKTTGTLTTFDQAQEILDELLNNKVSNISVSYKGWTSENLEYELGGALTISNKLGKTTTMNKFYEYCVQKNVTFYPELSITSAKGYDFSFGSLKYSTRGVGNEQAIHYPYDLSTGRQDKKVAPTYYISPLYYNSISEKLVSDFNKLNIWSSKQNGGFYLSDLGNSWVGNYRNGYQVYGGEAVYYQQEAISTLAEGNQIKISAPCDYAFKYVDVAVNVPVGTTMYTVYDYTIPFYQLVISGLFDYTTTNVNGSENRSREYYFAKALETGSNLSYMLSYEDPAILLETDYTEYYQVYYKNWMETIINFTKEINELGIHSCTLTNHEIVTVGAQTLSKVTYTNKVNSNETIELLINVTNKNVTYNGNVVPAYGYLVME